MMGNKIWKLAVIALWFALLANIGFTYLIASDVREMRRASALALNQACEELRAAIQHVAHPATIQRRTIDYILRQGEFSGSP